MIAGLALLVCGVSHAQNWTFYVSSERDFRVLLPGPPSRTVTTNGSVEYRTDTGSHRYSVFRHDPRRIANAAAARDDILARITSDEQRASNIGRMMAIWAPTSLYSGWARLGPCTRFFMTQAVTTNWWCRRARTTAFRGRLPGTFSIRFRWEARAGFLRS